MRRRCSDMTQLSIFGYFPCFPCLAFVHCMRWETGREALEYLVHPRYGNGELEERLHNTRQT